MRAPTFSGLGGMAWLLPNKSDVPAHQACLATYLLDIPGAHPFWHRWALSLIHLRPLMGVEPAHIRLSGATHEVIIAAIDPKWEPDPAADDLGFSRGVPFLRPIDVEEQVVLPSDAHARELAALAAAACCAGRLSPDQDWRSVWRTVLQSTAQCIREGKHDVH